MAAKRLHGGYEQDPDQPDDKRMRRLPSFSTVIREAVMVKHMQSLFRVLEPLLRRVVQEELQAGLVRSPGYIERSPETPPIERPAWKLAFRTPPQLPIFTGSKIEDASGNPLEIVLVDAETGLPAAASSFPQAALRVELVPLFGDFPPDGGDAWSAEDFQRSVVKERSGKRPLLTGDVSLTVRDGRAAVGELQFTDNSSWVRCRKFRIGVRVVPGSGYDGGRVLEAMTEAFVVRDHRGELYRKHYPPVLADDVWRLEKIGKEGAFHRKLTHHNVNSVQEFLRMLTVKPDELRAIMGDGMTDRMWEVTTNHAKTCVPGDKLYAYSAAQATIYMNSVFSPVRVDIGGVELPLQQLDRAQSNYVQHLVREAYEHRGSLQEVGAAMLHSHAATNIPLMHNAAHVALQSPPAADPQLWFHGAAELDFQDEVPLPQAANFGYQWPGQMFNMSG